jgi:hypothetical protein
MAMRLTSRTFLAVIALAVIGLAVVLAIDRGRPGGSPPGPAASNGSSPGMATFGVGSPTPSRGPASGGPSVSPNGPPSASPSGPQLDTGEGVDGRVPVALAGRIELYAGAVSVTPGQRLALHVSTTARQYTYAIERLDATVPSGGQVVLRSAVRDGHDYRSFGTFDTLDHTARANWPLTDTVDTGGWTPGIYVVTAHDTNGSMGQAIFVVRTPVLARGQPTFVFTALTYEAYNLWGGANLYAYAAPRAVRVSFERPYALEGGKGFWALGDDRILAWLQRRGLSLQYTTDYDLAVDPPAIAPRLLILPRHTEYVTASLRDWVEQHVNTAGDMNVVNFGSNGFYWQVRLAAPRTPGAPMDIVCYRSAAADPYASRDPALATTLWREPPLSRPEGLVFGAQYVDVLGNGYARYDYAVTAGMPPELIAGTGWQPGTVILGLLKGEGDLVYPGSGGIAIMDGRAATPKGAPLTTSVTIRTSSAGARVFDAGTFAWADGLEPARINLGVTAASFDRFNRNLLAWLGFPPRS